MSETTPTKIDREVAKNALIESSAKDTDTEKEMEMLRAKLLATEVSGKDQFFKLRKRWSNWIILWISLLILFNILLTFWVGLGNDNFNDSQWFLTLVTMETFLQIVGMGYIAVKFLFSHDNQKKD